MFTTQIQIAAGKIAALIYSADDQNTHRADELLMNPDVTSAARTSLLDSQVSFLDTGWHEGTLTFSQFVQSILEFPFIVGQRIRLGKTKKGASGCYGEIIGISPIGVSICIDGEQSSTTFRHSEVEAGFVMTGEATRAILEKLSTADTLYYSRFGTIRLEWVDGTMERWNLPGDIPDKTTVEYTVWRALDTHYRNEWMPVDQHEDYGQVCHKR